jgi:serine/threonine-protein kinase
MEEVAADLERVERGEIPAVVREMLSRSGGFDVPADYFPRPPPPSTQPAAPGPSPPPLATVATHPAAMPVRAASPTPANTTFRAVVATAATVAFLVVAGLVTSTLLAAPKRPRDEVSPIPSASVAVPLSTVGVPIGVDPVSASASAVTSAAPAPSARQVQIVTTPSGAVVFEGTTNLGQAPVSVPVPLDQVVTIRVEHAGFVSKERTLDGTKSRENITLDREVARGGAAQLKAPAPPKAPPAPASAKPAPPPVLPPPVTAAPCDPPRFRDPWDGKCH